MTHQTQRDIRKQEILTAGLKLAASKGYGNVSPGDIAEVVGIARTLVVFYFSTTAQLHRALVGEALRVRNLRVIAQALVAGDSRAKRAPDELKQEAIASILNQG